MRARGLGIHTLTSVFLAALADVATADHLVTTAGVESYVNVRAAPAADAPKVGELKGREHAALLGASGDWRKVRLNSGVVGYVNAGWTRVAAGSDFEHGEQAFDQGNYANAVAIWRPLAEAGDARAQFGLGNLYFNGLGVEENQRAATEWYRKSALQGYAPAQFNLGNAYKHGRGVPKDETLANQWWQKAADQGLASAQYNLGLQYYFGVGVEENREKATRLFALAAEQGHPKALTLFDAQAAPAAAPTKRPASRESAGRADVAASGEFESWIAKQSPDAYTIQILATRDTQSLKKFIDQSRFSDPVAWFRFERSGETWYGLIQGAYESRDQAEAAAEKIQHGANTNKVWIRRFADIHASMAVR